MENMNEVLFKEKERLVKESPELKYSLEKYLKDMKEFEKMKASLTEDKGLEEYFLFGAKIGT